MPMLIVEDHKGMRDMLRDYLRLAYPEQNILEAGDGESAMVLCLKHRPKLVLMDIGLPDSNGIDLTTRIKSTLSGTTVIIISSHRGSAYEERARAAGAAAYITKENVHRDLLPHVRRAFAAPSDESAALTCSTVLYGARTASNKRITGPVNTTDKSKVALAAAAAPRETTPAAAKPLKVLMVEDNPLDAELLARTLQEAGYDFSWARVQTEEDYQSALDHQPDIVLADYNLPAFDGPRALQVLQQRRLDIPFILVSGTVGEETAAEAIRLGADDYLLKDRLVRLPMAVTRALEQKRLRAEKSHAEEELREADLRLKSFFNYSPSITFIKDTSGRYLHVNHRFNQAFGFSPGQVIGKRDHEIFPPGQATAFRDNDRVVQRIGQAAEFEETAQHTDGPHISIVAKFPLHDAHGAVYGIGGIATDITERKREAVTHALLAAVVESSQDAIVSRSTDSRIMTWNKSAERLFGWSAEEAIGQGIALIVPPELREELARNIDHINSGQPVPPYETVRLAKDGRRIDVALSHSPIRDAQGNLLMVSHILRDIREQKAIEREMQRASRLTQLLETLARTVNESATSERALQGCLDHICAYGGWQIGHVMTLSTSISACVPISSLWHLGDWQQYAELIEVSAHKDYATTKGKFLGAVIRNKTPVWVEDLRSFDAGARVSLLTQRGMRCAFAFPIVVRNEVVAVMEFFSDAAHPVDAPLLENIGNVGSQLARVIEREHAHALLRESERHMRATFENAAVGIAHTGLDARFLRVNDKLCELLGYTREELLTLTTRDITHPDDLPTHGVDARHMLAGEIDGRGYASEKRFVRKDGVVIWTRRTVSLARDEAGKPLYYIRVIEDITERREAEDRFRATFDQPAIGVAHTALDGRYLAVNDRLCEMLGYPKQALLGMNARDLTHPDDRSAARERVERLLNNNQGSMYAEKRYIRKDGSIVWVGRSMSLIRDADGKPKYLVSMISDITAHKQAEEAVKKERSLLRAVVDAIPERIYVKDRDGRFLLQNATNLKVRGIVNHDDIVGKTVFDIFPRELAERLYTEDQNAMASGVPVLDREGRTFFGAPSVTNAHTHWHLTSKIPLKDEAGNVYGMVGVNRDITARKLQEQRIARLTRIKDVLSGINSAIIRVQSREELFRETCRIAIDHGKFRMAWMGVVDRAAACVKPIAWAGEDIIDTAPRPLARSDPTQKLSITATAVNTGQPVAVNDVEAERDKLPYGKQAFERGYHSNVALPLVVEGKVVGVIALHAEEKNFFDDEEMTLLRDLASDVSFGLMHIDKKEKLDYLAYYDTLTGLPNRTLLHERLTHHLNTAERDHQKPALLILDVARFRTINESLGRAAGDMLLREIAARITHFSPYLDSVARIGTDVFAIITSVQNESTLARELEAAMRQCFGKPFHILDNELIVSAKVGVALFPNDGADADTLLRNAEAALKRAKTINETYLFYAEDMTARVAEKLKLESELRRALENEEFVLHYQPKVRLDTRKVEGVEALIRWMSPSRGLVPPLQFIPLLEETGLIREVGAWALQRARLDYAHWRERGLSAPRVAVNVSSVQLQQKDFVDIVKNVLPMGGDDSGLDLEITESLIMRDMASNIDKLRAIRDLGVNLSIDDFGTGYSSLGYLSTLPVQSLKIDRSFIIKMLDDPNTMTVVSTIISLAHSMRLKVIAEGVETEDQANVLRLLSCDQIQGYLISRPVDRDKMSDFLGKHE